MKSLFLALLFIVTACGKSGDSSGKPINNVNLDDFEPTEEISLYRFEVSALDPVEFGSIAYANFGLSGGTQNNWAATLQNGSIVLFGKNALWNFVKRSGPDVTITLRKNEIIIEQIVITQDDLTFTLRDNI